MGCVQKIVADTATAPLKGLKRAKTIYCDGLAEIQYQGGTNARYFPFTWARDKSGVLIRKVSVVFISPIGAMSEADRLMRAFMAEHFLDAHD